MEKEDLIKKIKEELQNLMSSSILNTERTDYDNWEQNVTEKVSTMKKKNEFISAKLKELTNLSTIVRLQSQLENNQNK